MDDAIVNTSERAADVATPGPTATNSGITTSGIAPPQRDIAYTIKDASFPALHIYASANAWWTERGKVERLIEAFKAGHLVRDACIYAGITTDQWKYFNEVHPHFSPVQEICERLKIFPAMETVNKGIKTDPRLALRYLERVHDGFKPKLKVEDDTPAAAPTVNVNVDAHVDTTKIEELLAGKLAGYTDERDGAGAPPRDNGPAVAQGDPT